MVCALWKRLVHSHWGQIGLIGKMGKKYILFSLNADLEARNHGNQHDVKDYYALANECGGLEA